VASGVQGVAAGASDLASKLISTTTSSISVVANKAVDLTTTTTTTISNIAASGGRAAAAIVSSTTTTKSLDSVEGSTPRGRDITPSKKSDVTAAPIPVAPPVDDLVNADEGVPAAPEGVPEGYGADVETNDAEPVISLSTARKSPSTVASKQPNKTGKPAQHVEEGR
jgi:hypothetical protein